MKTPLKNGKNRNLLHKGSYILYYDIVIPMELPDVFAWSSYDVRVKSYGMVVTTVGNVERWIPQSVYSVVQVLGRVPVKEHELSAIK